MTEAAAEPAAEPVARPEHNPARGRAPRIETRRRERRRRRAGTLNRMAQFKLDIFDESQLDLQNYVYRWVDDEGSRIRQVTKGDDYDFVQTHELGEEFDAESTDSESSDRVRMLSGRDGQGNPTYTYLLRKPREYFEDDMQENVDLRQSIMEQRVYEGREDLDADDFDGEAVDERLAGSAAAAREARERDGEEMTYVPKGNKLGGPSGRRRTGPITPRK